MVKTGHYAVYNSRILYMLTLRSSSLRAAGAALVIALFACPGITWAGDWGSSEQQLAAKIVAITGAGPASMEVTNRSSLGTSDADDIRRGLISQLSSQGMKWDSPGSAPFAIQVSLSENTAQYVWVAQVRKGSSDPTVVMVATSRANIGPVRDTTAITLRKALLWSSDTQILDAIVINGSPQRMAVLYPGQIQFYRSQNDHWAEDQSFAVAHSRPWSRDLRGRLVLGKDRSLEAHLPGVVCQSTQVGPLSFHCREADDPWPVGTEQYPLNAFFAQTRNFFTGVLSPGIGNQSTVPPFYSAAPVPASGDRSTAWLLAGVDGRIHVLEGASDLVIGKLNWGSDIAAVHGSCGSRWQVLSTSSGPGEPDSVRAYEISGNEATAVGQTLAFPGAISSLWTTADGSSGVAVAHNSETGKYEAYMLTMACSQ